MARKNNAVCFCLKLMEKLRIALSLKEVVMTYKTLEKLRHRSKKLFRNTACSVYYREVAIYASALVIEALINSFGCLIMCILVVKLDIY